MSRAVARRIWTWAACLLLALLSGSPVWAVDQVQGPPSPDDRWFVVPSPNAGSLTNVATSIAFSSRSDGWLVGGRLRQVGENTAFRTLVEHWDGEAWSLVGSPNPGLDNTLTGVVARGPEDAWAVGWFTQIDETGGSISLPLIEHWDGEAWSVVPAPDIGAEAGSLAAITADRAGGLWAVGSRTVKVGSPERTLVLHHSKGVWTIVPAQDAPGRYNRLTGVTATGPDVWAVGLTMDPSGSGPNATLIEALDPAAGRIVPSPNPREGGNELHGVAARGPADVWAVGIGWGPSGTVPLAVHFDGSSWRTVSFPRDGVTSGLLGVVRAGGRQFWAVGYVTRDAVHHPLIERWTGSRWVKTPSPSPHVSGDMLAAVASPPGWRAMAVGNGIDVSGYARTLVLAEDAPGPLGPPSVVARSRCEVAGPASAGPC